MPLVKKLKIGVTDYTIRDKNTFRSLTSDQTTQLLSNGTYEGDFVPDGEIFTSDDGKFKEYNTSPGVYDGELVACDFTPNSSYPQQEVVWGKLGDTVYYIDASNDPTGAANYEIQGTTSQGLFYSHLGGFFLGDGETELGYMFYDEDYHVIEVDQMDNGDLGYVNGSPIQYPGVVGKTCGKYFIGEKYSDNIDSYYVAYHYIDEIPINNGSTDLHSITTFPSGVTKPMFFILSDKVIMVDIATGSVYHLTTLGGSWTYDGTSNILNSYSSDCYDSPQVVNGILLVRWQGTWYRSTDYGLTFTQFTSGIDNERANILYDPNTRTYVAIIYGEPDYYWTSFDCDTWVKQTNMNSCQVGFNSTINGLVIADSKIYSFYGTDSSYIDVKISGEQRSLTDLSLNKSEVEGMVPNQTGHADEFLFTNGVNTFWTNEVDIKTTEYFNILGSPTISNGIASGFSSTNGLQLQESFAPSTNTWEIVMKVYPMTASESQQYFFDKPYNNDLGIKFIYKTTLKSVSCVCKSSTGVWLDTPDNSVPLNAWTYVKFVFDGENYLVYLSSDGETWGSPVATQQGSAIESFSANTLIGRYASTNNNIYYFRGRVDLQECYIKINGETWWKPYRTTITPSKV